MKTIRYALVLLLLLCTSPAHTAEISIGVDIAEYPDMVLVPDYPVYYAPAVGMNYFFYDGDFWMYQDDNWYRSPWYDGPWERVYPEDVPDVLLQVPVRYYMQPPAYFFSWWNEDPPHWGEHWGRDWERHRHGWNNRDQRQHDEPAPLPEYQRHYPGDRYPTRIDRQHELKQKYYPYQAHDPLALQHHKTQPVESAPVLQNRDRVPGAAHPTQRNIQRTNPLPQDNQEVQRKRVKGRDTAVLPQPAHMEVQPRPQQARPETIHNEKRLPRTENVEIRRSERDAVQEKTRGVEKERNRER